MFCCCCFFLSNHRIVSGYNILKHEYNAFQIMVRSGGLFHLFNLPYRVLVKFYKQCEMMQTCTAQWGYINQFSVFQSYAYLFLSSTKVGCTNYHIMMIVILLKSIYKPCFIIVQSQQIVARQIGSKIYSVISDTLLYQISLCRVFICKHDYEVFVIVIQYFELHLFKNMDPLLM